MKNINKNVFEGVVGGLGLGNAMVYLPTGEVFSAAVAAVVGVVMVVVAFARKGEEKQDV